MKLSIVIPVFNESKTLPVLLHKIDQVLIPGFEKEIILVDDASTDSTREFLKTCEQKYRVYYHDENRGKGAALRTGFAGASGEWVIIQDADLEYEPKDIARLLDVAMQENRQVLYGSRILDRSNRSHSTLPSYIGARLLTLITNWLYGIHLTDEPTCYKLFRRELLMDLKLTCERFEFCPEVTAKIARRGIEIKEIPIKYYPRSRAEGKKINWPDFLEAVWVLVKERF